MAKHNPTTGARSFLKAYRRNEVINGQDRPDLTISEDPQDKRWFVFGGTDADLGLFVGFTKGSEVHQSWHYERLELYADGQNLTFVMPTISTDNAGEGHQVSTLKGATYAYLILQFHMLLLDGEQRTDGETTIPVKMQLFRNDQGTTTIWAAELGNEKTWGKGLFANTIELSNFGSQLVSGIFTENLNKMIPGPLLQAASVSSFLGNDKLEIALSEIAYDEKLPDKKVRTFVLTFTPGPGHGPLNITASGTSKLPPVHATKGTYQIVQRPTNGGLARSSGRTLEGSSRCIPQCS